MQSVLEPGDHLGPWRFDRIKPERITEMALVQNDPNPIHLDAGAVAAIGLGDRQVNQGTANVGYVLNMLRESAPHGRIERLQVRLLSNVFAGDIVVAGGLVDSVEGTADDRRLDCIVWLDVEGGTRAVEGRAVIRVSCS